MSNWDPSIFNSYARIQNFFIQSPAYSQVLSRKTKLCTKNLNPLNPNLSWEWKVCQTATAPFRYLFALVLKIISGISSIVGAKTVQKNTKEHTRQLIMGFNGYSTETTHLFKIKASENDPNSEAEIIAKTPTIPASQITDPKVKSRTFCSIEGGVSFKNRASTGLGICRGMVHWFINLYLKTKNQFSDPRSHMKALGKQFQRGGGLEATLLQCLYLRKGKLLGLKIQDHCFSPSKTDWLNHESSHIHFLQNLGGGAYHIHVPKHALAYIKVRENLGFFFNPNWGIIEINGEEQGKNLYQLVNKAVSSSGEHTGALAESGNRIRFDPVIVRTN